MSENPETDQNNTTKRVRIQEPTKSTENGKPVVKTPKALALACISGHVASLHPQVAKIIQSYGTKQVNLHAKLRSKQQQFDRMQKDVDFIPRSARINFEFYVRPEIRESDDFQVIQQETSQIITDFQLNLKSSIVRTVVLEVDFLKRELNENIIQLIYHSTKAFHLLHNPMQMNPTVTCTVAHLINAYGDNLLKYTTLDKQVFKHEYARIFNDQLILNLSTSNNVTNANDPNNPYARNRQLSQDNTVLPSYLGEASRFIDSLRNTLEAILHTSFMQYENQVHTNKVASQLEAYSTEVLHENATANTTERMDTSNHITPENKEVVKKSTQTAISSLTKEIQSLKDKLKKSNQLKQGNKTPQKNSSKRGLKGASEKKKSHNQSKRSTSDSPSPRRRNRSRGRKGDHENQSKDSKKDSRNNNKSENNSKNHKSRRRSRSRTRKK